jgi:alkylated DNA repair dioxygenase AlkB
MSAPIIYISDFCKEDAESFFKQLWTELAWIRHDKVPRREYYINKLGVPYNYGTPPFDRTYESQPTHPVIEKIREMVEAELEKRFGKKHVMDVCFLNGYEDQSDQIGWHSDDSEEMDDDRAIAIVSLYPDKKFEREIWFRPSVCHVCKAKIGEKHDSICSVMPREFEPHPADVEKVKLENGSLAIMEPGMQDTHQHRIPKASFMCGERISLTFRGYV